MNYFRIHKRTVDALLHCTIKLALPFPVALILLCSDAGMSQVRPDSSLGQTSSKVSSLKSPPNRSGELVSGGRREGSNLFHSFSEFNVGKNQEVYFKKPAGIRSIFARVTGRNASSLDGVLGVLGDSDLFLINPNGILFGLNSRLDIRGSFLATTAKSIRFDDKNIFHSSSQRNKSGFSGGDPEVLSFSGSSAPIVIEGPGHNLLDQGQQGREGGFIVNEPTFNLRVPPGETIGLFGGSVSLSGAIVSAPSGQVSVASVSSGSIILNHRSEFKYSPIFKGVESYGDIELSLLSMLDTSGDNAGQIELNARNIRTKDNSVILNQYLGNERSGEINLIATNLIEIGGDSRFTPMNELIFPVPPVVARGISADVFGSGRGADISITSRELVLSGSTRVGTVVYSDGTGGNINIDVKDNVRLLGPSMENPLLGGAILTVTSLLDGTSGSLNLNTTNLYIEEGAQVSSAVFGTSQGDDLRIKARKIEVSGIDIRSTSPSLIGSVNFGSGEGGNLFIHADELLVLNGGSVNASTFAQGNAGNINIKSKLVNLSGSFPSIMGPSSEIVASADTVNPLLRFILNLPEFPSGKSGSIDIDTNQLIISDGATLTVSNLGKEDAGILKVSSESILLDNGRVSLGTNGGNGGSLDFGSVIVSLIGDSEINTSATGSGLGGNIQIATDILAILDESSISANAENALGGNILIDAQAFLLAPTSLVTATSALGPRFDGQIEINIEDRPVVNERTKVEKVRVDNVAIVCSRSAPSRQSSFIVRGTGGLATQPRNISQKLPVSLSSLNAAKVSLSAPFVIDRETGKKVYLMEPSSFLKQPDGTLAFAVDAQMPGQDRSVLLSSACLRSQALKS